MIVVYVRETIVFLLYSVVINIFPSALSIRLPNNKNKIRVRVNLIWMFDMGPRVRFYTNFRGGILISRVMATREKNNACLKQISFFVNLGM